MKHIAFILLFIISSFQLGYTQEDNNLENPILTFEGLKYKDILDTIADQRKTFEQKYDVVRSIILVQPFDKVLDIYKSILEFAKHEDDKKYVLNLYAAIANNHLIINDSESAKAYLDSAHTYVDKVEEAGALGLYYFIEGRYYAYVLDELCMIDSYYKSISYFDQVENRKTTVVMLLYAIGAHYHQYKDISNMKRILERMLTLAEDINEQLTNIQTYSLAAGYYDLAWGSDSIKTQKDSIIYYNKEIIKEYDRIDQNFKKSATDLVVQSYINLAEFMIVQINSGDHNAYDWEEIEQYITESSKIRAENDIINDFRYYYLMGEVYAHNKKYSKAIENAKISLDIVKNNNSLTLNNISMYRVYNLLYRMEEQIGNYKSAIEYLKQSYLIYERIHNEKMYDTGKELAHKYETTQKDLEISQLNEREQKLLFNRTLIITISIIVAILLLLAVLYFRFKKQQKEKEAILKDKRIEEKEYEYQTLLKESENKQMRQYLDGLENERTRLAKELHDNVANELYVALMELGNLKAVPDSVANKMKDLHTQIRSISHDLMPPQFQYASLSDILYNHFIVLEKQTDIVFRFDVDDIAIFENIPSALSHEIYRIVQECTGNIIKHSSAKNAIISLSKSDNQIKLVVKDDGKGFNSMTAHKGIGLHIIKERCHSLGGDMHIDSEIGNGCTITILIPPNDSEMQ